MSGAKSYEPLLCVERAELARLAGDEATRKRELREAHNTMIEKKPREYAYYRLLALHGEGKTSREVADLLTAEGLVTALGHAWTERLVNAAQERIRKNGLPRPRRRSNERTIGARSMKPDRMLDVDEALISIALRVVQRAPRGDPFRLGLNKREIEQGRDGR